MRSDKTRPPASQESRGGLEMAWLATPGAVFSHPRDVLDHEGLEPSEKRAILASWASDVRAVESAPALRQLDCGAVVRLDEVLEALCALDAAARPRRAQARPEPFRLPRIFRCD